MMSGSIRATLACPGPPVRNSSAPPLGPRLARSRDTTNWSRPPSGAAWSIGTEMTPQSSRGGQDTRGPGGEAAPASDGRVARAAPRHAAAARIVRDRREALMDGQ